MLFFLSSSVNYADAVAFKNKRRNVKPPVYNPNRMNELPMPDTTSDESENVFDDGLNGNFDNIDENATNENEFSITEDNPLVSVFAESLPVVDSNSFTDQEQQSNPTETHSASESQNVLPIGNEQHSLENAMNLVDPETGHLMFSSCGPSSMENGIELTRANLGQTGESSINETVSLQNEDIKPDLVPLYETAAANRNEIVDLITELEEEELDDDVSIFVNRSMGVPMPLKVTTGHALVKRENDILSGSAPYNNEVGVFVLMLFSILIVRFFFN